MNLSTIIEAKQFSKPVTTGLNKKQEYADIDLLYEHLSDLVNSEFRAWYCSKFFSIGRQRVLELASMARADGNDSKKLFSVLLKKEK